MPDGASLDLAAEERATLVEEIIAGLEARGAAGGTWLVDIATVRSALRAADQLLQRMQAVILAEAAPPDGLAR
jgi:hypothetical protein